MSGRSDDYISNMSKMSEDVRNASSFCIASEENEELHSLKNFE